MNVLPIFKNEILEDYNCPRKHFIYVSFKAYLTTWHVRKINILRYSSIFHNKIGEKSI